jgi:hypothetical protein
LSSARSRDKVSVGRARRRHPRLEGAGAANSYAKGISQGFALVRLNISYFLSALSLLAVDVPLDPTL